MLKVHSEPPKPKLASGTSTLLALGFRPFFILAGLSALTLLTIWLGAWSGAFPVSDYYGIIGWHSHEMLFGYTTAVVAGFLLTAVRNWTGVNTPSGMPLGLLALLWLVGRVLPLLGNAVPSALIALVDLSFLPAVALAIQPALWQGQQKVNRIFVPLLLVMAIANLLVHLQALGYTDTAAQGTDMMLYLVVFLVLLLGGRVIPFFTEAVVPGHKSKRWPALEIAAMGIMIALVVVQPIYPAPWLTGLIATAAALIQLVRLSGWHSPQVWKTPILWVLYSALIWIVIGLALTGLAGAGLVVPSLAKHALTVGGIGTLTLGMMARVALGHTGRPIAPVRLIEFSFILINIATALRVFGPMILAEKYNLWVHISGGLWIISFLLFTIVYLPMLMKPRADGKEG
jgi:uncharacterized protein involved in response to NO